MAEIRVEKKTGPGPWPVIIGIVVLAALAWLLFGAGGDEDDFADESGVMSDTMAGGVDPGPVMGADEVDGAVEGYLVFVRETGATEAAGETHDYASEGLQKLADAIASVAEGDAADDTAVNERLDNVRDMADQLSAEADAAQHAGLARQSFLAATEAMAALDPAGDVASLRQAAEAIQPEVQLLDQTQAVQSFFEQAGEALAQLSPMANR
ncbi:MAG: hypothetical protein H0U86_08005 [Chloroflexi bacterium]|nr:hypothetical protein [Chloroflexota bacterium]